MLMCREYELYQKALAEQNLQRVREAGFFERPCIQTFKLKGTSNLDTMEYVGTVDEVVPD